MSKTFQRQNIILSLILIAIILLCLICSALGIAYAENEAQNDINIIHISDLHYYPTYMCKKQTASDYDDSAMVQKSKLESKLLIESSSVIKKLFDEIAIKAPDYLVVTGDLSSDGEKVALIEIANALRDLQNRIRIATKKDFQIFVIPGNHDIANKNATNYAKGEQVEYVTRYEFAKIFAGLGFPKMDEGEAEIFYADYKIDPNDIKYLPYETTNAKYVFSDNLASIDFVRTPNFLSTSDGENSSYLSDGDLSYIAKCEKNNTFLALDGIVAGSVGGKIQNSVFEWLDSLDKDILSGNLMSLTHQNVLPHFTMQEQWTKNYLYSNWEQIKNYFLKIGVKYNFSGHMHANDIASYCNYDGYNLYDIETGSPVGYGANFRETKISFYQSGASDMLQTLNTLSDVDVTLLVENDYLVLDNDKKIIDNLASYISDNLYDNMLSNVLDSAIQLITKENFVHFVITKFADINDSDIVNGIFVRNIDTIRRVIGNFYDAIQKQTLSDFVYTGDKTFLKTDKLRAYLYDFAEQVIDQRILDDYTVQNMFVDAYTTHLKGGEDTVLSNVNANLKYSLEEWMPSGKLVQNIIDIARSGENNIAKLIKQVLSSEYDLSVGLSSDEIREINGILLFIDSNVHHFNLDKLIIKFFGDKLDGIPSQKVDKILDNLVIDNLAKGIGENLSEVIRSLVTDETYDGIVGLQSKVLFDKEDEFSHYAEGKVREASVKDGRLPNMITMSFGESFADRNFVWYTDPSITATDFQISLWDIYSFSPMEWNNMSASCEIVDVDKPLIDLGIMTTYTTRQLARHTLSIKGLKSKQQYTIRVGDKKKGYLSDYYTFTMPDLNEKTPFDILIVTDMQGVSDKDYNDISKLLTAAQRESALGYDFVLNLGDSVTSGKNTNQWESLINNSKKIFATIPQIMVAGNHDVNFKKDSTDIETASGISPLDLYFNPGNKNTDKNYYSFNYKGVHFIVLDTNDLNEGKNNLSFEQIEWLENDLKNNAENLVVVSMHKGIYSAGPHRKDSEIENMRKTLSKMFSDYKVELVLQGHDHIYSESFFLDGEGNKVKAPPYKQNSPINNNNGGVLYVTMGSSGNKFYSLDESAKDFINIDKSKLVHSPKLDKPTFGKIFFDGENIKFSSYEYDLETDKVNQLVAFNNNAIFLTISIVSAVIVLAGVIILIVFLLRSHKKKIAKCKQENLANLTKNLK